MISWSTQRLPSGSLNDARAKYERPCCVEARGPRLLHLADVDAAADEIVPGGVDVLDHEDQPLGGSRLSRRAALADLDRALASGAA